MGKKIRDFKIYFNNILLDGRNSKILKYILVIFKSFIAMGRMQMKGKGKGISSSALPYKRRAPRWVTLSSSALMDMIVK